MSENEKNNKRKIICAEEDEDEDDKHSELLVSPLRELDRKQLRPVATSLDDTTTKIRGRGILAADKDIKGDVASFTKGCEFLLFAARGDLESMKEMIQADLSLLQFRDYDRRTALHVAASEGYLNIVRYLVESGVDVNRSDRWGGSALDDSHRHDHPDVAKYLRLHGGKSGTLEHGKKSRTMDLISAASKGQINAVKQILAMGDIDANEGDYDGRTALHLAAGANYPKMTEYLITEAKANVNAEDAWGGRPLDDAQRNNCIDTIEILMTHGAKPGVTHVTGAVLDDSGKTGHMGGENLQVEFDELEIIDRIGSGAFGEILKCRWRGTLVAAKCVKSAKIYKNFIANYKQANGTGKIIGGILKSTNEEESSLNTADKDLALRDFRIETKILKQLRHPNICMLLAYSTTPDYEVMISELMKCSLADLLRAHQLSNTKLSKKTQASYAQQLAQGMNYLHTCHPPILHRDLKPANLLIDYSGILKISDFGLAKLRPKDFTTRDTSNSLSESRHKQLFSEVFVMTGETGSYRFMAPEVFLHLSYNEKVDVYSFAMIIFNIYMGSPPWPTLNGVDAVRRAAETGARPAIPRDWDYQLGALLKQCWEQDPKERPSFQRILATLNEYTTRVFGVKDEIVREEQGGKTLRDCCVVS